MTKQNKFLIRKRYSDAKRRGFTLIELMCALTILFILCLIAYPSFSAIRNQLHVSEDARSVALILGEVRAEAIRLKRTVRVSFTSNKMQWDIYDDGTLDGSYVFHSGTTWTATPANIVFNGFGLARGIVGMRTMTLSKGSNSNSVKINSNGHVEL